MRLYTYPYSDDYSPPMPVVELGVGWPGSHQPAQTIVAVLDSGAGQRVSVYLASLRVGPHVLHAVRVVAIPEGSESILGRNALQYLTVTLDGPAHSAEIRA